MDNRGFEIAAQSNTRQSRQTAESQTEVSGVQRIPVSQHDPLAQVTSRVGNDASARTHAAVLDRATAGQPARSRKSLLRLQRQYGNCYVRRVLTLAGKRENSQASPDVSAAIRRARGSGHALDSGVRAQMEPTFGAEFGRVRVHTDAEADTLSRSLNARAFTTGQDIFFRQGTYSPGSSSGRELLAHELTHVVQQTGSKVQRKLTVGRPGDRYEQEADRIARAVIRQEQQATPTSMRQGMVQRQAEEEEETAQTQPVQRQDEEKEETAQTQLVQRQAEEEEETAQTQLVQRQAEEEEETAQTQLVQRQAEEEEETAQTQLVQRQDEEEEETAQTQSAQRQAEEEEETAQTQSAQRQAEEEEETAQTQLVQRQAEEEEETAETQPVQRQTEQKETPIQSKLTAGQASGPLVVQRAWGFGSILEKAGSWIGSAVKRGVRYVTKGIKKGLKFLRLGFKFILRKIRPYLRKVPGYDLLRVIIGKDPITGTKVPRTPRNLVRGLLGRRLHNKLNKTGAIDQAFSWLSAQVKRLNLSPAKIWRLVKRVVRHFVNNPTDIFSAFPVLKRYFGPPISRIWRFIKAIGHKIGEFILRGALRLVGADPDRIIKLLKGALGRILRNPIRFARNLVKAVKLGFSRFKNNFTRHFKNAIAGWLFGTLSDAGIELPQKFDLKGIFSLVAQILGLTYRSIRAEVVRRLGPRGEQIVSAVEKTVEFVKELITKGPIALWERVKDAVGNIKQMLFEQVLGWVRNKIIVSAITKLVSMLNPVGAIIQAAMAIYNTIMFFIERWEQIKALASAVLNSITRIASGRIGSAARYVERVMAKSLTLIISFLARLLNLGGISKQIRKVIQRIRGPIDRAKSKVIKWIVKRARKLFGKAIAGVRKGKEKVAQLLEWWKLKRKFRVGKEGHTLYFRGKGRAAELMMASNGGKSMAQIAQELDAKEVRSLLKQLEPVKRARKRSKLENKRVKQMLERIAKALSDSLQTPKIRIGIYQKIKKSGGHSHHVPNKVLKKWVGETYERIANTALWYAEASMELLCRYKPESEKYKSCKQEYETRKREYQDLAEIGKDMKTDRVGNDLSAIWLPTLLHVKVHKKAGRPQRKTLIERIRGMRRRREINISRRLEVIRPVFWKVFNDELRTNTDAIRLVLLENTKVKGEDLDSLLSKLKRLARVTWANILGPAATK